MSEGKALLVRSVFVLEKKAIEGLWVSSLKFNATMLSTSPILRYKRMSFNSSTMMCDSLRLHADYIL